MSSMKKERQIDWDEIVRLLELAKGDDRSFRQYANDAGVQHSLFSKIKRREFCPGFETLARILSRKAKPRNGVTITDFLIPIGSSGSELIETVRMYDDLLSDYMWGQANMFM